MKPLCVTVWTFVCLFSVLFGTSAGISPSAVASFNDTRCKTGGVCSTDPLLFTCGLQEVSILRVWLPTGYQESVSVGDNVKHLALPAGFTAVSLNILELDTNRIRNIFVTLSIANASLLDGGEIACDDTIEQNVTAGCPLLKAAPSAPFNLTQICNNLTAVTITWKGTETNVTYTVTSTSFKISEIMSKSSVLRDLEVETDYIVSVIAVNECGDESQPSNITVRIDMNGTDVSDSGGDGDGDGGDGDGDGGRSDDGSGKWLSTAVLCGITGVGVFIIIAGGGTCLLLIFLFKKKTKTKVDEQKMNFLSPSPGPASPVSKETPADYSGDVKPAHQDPITTMDTSHHSDPPKQVVIDSTYSTIADLHTTYPESGTPCPSQPYLDGPVTEEISIPASDADPYYQDPNTITHTPHPTTGVIYTNPEKKKKVLRAIDDALSIQDVNFLTSRQKTP